MKNDILYQHLVDKMREVAALPPQEAGPFTYLYKSVVPRFKTKPWKSTTILALLATSFLYFLFGTTLVKLVSTIQFGF